MRILISGASIAGPVLGYWLTRHGFEVTVVERAPALRKTGGHAVDLFRSAMRITEQMGVLPRVLEHATGIQRLQVHRPGARRSVEIDYTKLFAAMSTRHVEIMRDDLSEIYYDAGRDDIEYLFGDQVTAISQDGDVTFAHAPARRFDLIVGADGLHSGIRRLTFGPEADYTEFLGAYLAVVSVPKSLARDGESIAYVDINRMATVYTADNLDDARALFMFRTEEPFDYDHRDTAAQHTLLRNRFARLGPEVDEWLGELDRTSSFYFDSITQLQLSKWSRGRVVLVGDAAYCPGPAVGGSTSLAVLGAYTLAGELARAGGDYPAAFEAYERVMADPVVGSRAVARGMAKHFVPHSTLGVRALIGAGRLASALPPRIAGMAIRLNGRGLGFFDAMQVPEYAPAVA